MSAKTSNRIPLLRYGLQSANSEAARLPAPHRHHEMELNYIETGQVEYLFGDKVIVVTGGEIAVFWAAIPHHIIRFAPSTKMRWLTFPLGWLMQWPLPEAFAREVWNDPGFVLCPANNPDATAVLFQQWQRDLQLITAERMEIIRLEVEALLRRMALYWRPDSPTKLRQDSLPGSPGLQHARRLAQFVARSYTDNLSVERIAQAAGLHPNYAMSVFRAQLGMSILDYIAQYRVNHAQRLLLTTDEPISVIARQSGFGSRSQFHAIFKRICDMTPHQYRRTMRLGKPFL